MEVFAVVLVPLVTGAFATVWLLPLWWPEFCLFVPKDKIPVITDWATVLIWMWQKHILSPHWNFCSERPGRASVCPPLQSIKRSLNVNFCFVSFTHFTLRIRLQCTGNNIGLDLLSEPWQYRDKWSYPVMPKRAVRRWHISRYNSSTWKGWTTGNRSASGLEIHTELSDVWW